MNKKNIIFLSFFLFFSIFFSFIFLNYSSDDNDNIFASIILNAGGEEETTEPTPEPTSVTVDAGDDYKETQTADTVTCKVSWSENKSDTTCTATLDTATSTDVEKSHYQCYKYSTTKSDGTVVSGSDCRYKYYITGVDVRVHNTETWENPNGTDNPNNAFSETDCRVKYGDDTWGNWDGYTSCTGGHLDEEEYITDDDGNRLYKEYCFYRKITSGNGKTYYSDYSTSTEGTSDNDNFDSDDCSKHYYVVGVDVSVSDTLTYEIEDDPIDSSDEASCRYQWGDNSWGEYGAECTSPSVDVLTDHVNANGLVDYRQYCFSKSFTSSSDQTYYSDYSASEEGRTNNDTFETWSSTGGTWNDDCSRHYVVTSTDIVVDEYSYEDMPTPDPDCTRYYANGTSFDCDSDVGTAVDGYDKNKGNYTYRIEDNADDTEGVVDDKMIMCYYWEGGYNGITGTANNGTTTTGSEVCTTRYFVTRVDITDYPQKVYTGIKDDTFKCIAYFDGDPNNQERDVSTTNIAPATDETRSDVWTTEPYNFMGISKGSDTETIPTDNNRQTYTDPRGTTFDVEQPNIFYSKDAKTDAETYTAHCEYYNKENSNYKTFYFKDTDEVEIEAHSGVYHTDSVTFDHYGPKEIQIKVSGYFYKPGSGGIEGNRYFADKELPSIRNTTFQNSNIDVWGQFDFVTGHWYDFRAYLQYGDNTGGTGYENWRDITSTAEAPEVYWWSEPWYNRDNSKSPKDAYGTDESNPGKYYNSDMPDTGLEHRIPADRWNIIHVEYFNNEMNIEEPIESPDPLPIPAQIRVKAVPMSMPGFIATRANGGGQNYGCPGQYDWIYNSTPTGFGCIPGEEPLDYPKLPHTYSSYGEYNLSSTAKFYLVDQSDKDKLDLTKDWVGQDPSGAVFIKGSYITGETSTSDFTNLTTDPKGAIFKSVSLEKNIVNGFPKIDEHYYLQDYQFSDFNYNGNGTYKFTSRLHNSVVPWDDTSQFADDGTEVYYRKWAFTARPVWETTIELPVQTTSVNSFQLIKADDTDKTTFNNGSWRPEGFNKSYKDVKAWAHQIESIQICGDGSQFCGNGGANPPTTVAETGMGYSYSAWITWSDTPSKYGTSAENPFGGNRGEYEDWSNASTIHWKGDDYEEMRGDRALFVFGLRAEDTYETDGYTYERRLEDQYRSVFVYLRDDDRLYEEPKINPHTGDQDWDVLYDKLDVYVGDISGEVCQDIRWLRWGCSVEDTTTWQTKFNNPEWNFLPSNNPFFFAEYDVEQYFNGDTFLTDEYNVSNRKRSFYPVETFEQYLRKNIQDPYEYDYMFPVTGASSGVGFK